MKKFSCIIFMLAFCFCLQAQDKVNMDWIKKVGARKMPASKKTFWVNDFGATSNGSKVTTSSIQKAIDACAQKGGGIVRFKQGTYLTGSIFLKENVHLLID